MRVAHAILPSIALLVGVPAAADETPPLAEVGMDQTSGCLDGPTAQFGRYIGDWDIQDWQLSRADGETWEEQNGARWLFTCVGNGVAIQDFWHRNNGGFGTDLRIYDPTTESWDIAWASTGAPGITRISAKEDKAGNIVMDYISPLQNPMRRITFFTPTKNGWDWIMEISTD